jgi:hypothetical protein
MAYKFFCAWVGRAFVGYVEVAKSRGMGVIKLDRR